MKANDGGLAFPSGERYTRTDLMGNQTSNSKGPLHKGMTLRQWYAGLAMQGMLAANPDWDESVVEWAFKLADAMVACGQKEEKSK
jgi:hypothetical protein